jgi:iron complex outermembrane receptor protein
MIPPNRLDNQVKYELPDVGKWKKVFMSAGNLFVAQQKRVPAASDFLPPPKAYSLWSLQAGATIQVTEKQHLEIGVSVQNLFNTVYRDYLNRFRYYANDMGRNGSLRLKWKFGA